MNLTVSINGLIVDPSAATVSVFDRGFLYGDSVFEVLRTYGGRPHALDEHLARLRASADRVGIDLPVSAAQLRHEIAETITAAGEGEGTVRFTITRGAGEHGLDPSLAREPQRIVIVRPLPRIEPALYRDGTAAALVTIPRPSELVTGAKTGNYLLNILAIRAAKKHGMPEALLVTPDGAVLEAASANVFIVVDGVVLTPPVSSGILPGITREQVLTIARARGVVSREIELTTTDLWTADEVFLTSSIREIVPVVQIDEHEVGTGRPGAVMRSLHRAYRADVGAGGVMPWES